MKKQSKQKKVAESIGKLEVGEYLDAYAFIVENWEDYNFFIRRSFDVYLCQAKKQFPEREFKVEDWFIKRVK